MKKPVVKKPLTLDEKKLALLEFLKDHKLKLSISANPKKDCIYTVEHLNSRLMYLDMIIDVNEIK